MRRFLSSLSGQLILLISAVLILAQAGGAYFFFDERDLAVRTALGLEAAGRAANLARLVEKTPANLRAGIVMAANSPLVRFTLDEHPDVSRQGNRPDGPLRMRLRSILGHETNRDIRLIVEPVDPMMEDMNRMPVEMRPMHQAMLEQGTEPVALHISIGLSDGNWLNVRTMFHQPPIQVAWSTWITLGTSIVLTAAALLWALRRITYPLAKLSAAAERLGRGEAVDDLTPTGPREVQTLTQAFNRMRERLTRFVSERTRILAALSHDLRSPLTAMKLRIELLNVDENQQRLQRIVDEMQEMVEATLAFARGTASHEPHIVFDISDLVHEVTDEFDGGVTLPDQLPLLAVRAQRINMKRVLRNIVENALRYAGSATIRAGENRDMAEIWICDEGPGIPEDKMEEVFDPFVRLEDSRSRETGGTGLGLTIARTLVRANGGDIRLLNRLEDGLCVEIALPLATDIPEEL